MFKKIASNTFAQLVAKFVGAGLTLLTTYYIIRLAGLDLYGNLTKVLVLVAVGFTAIDFGLNAEAVRYGNTLARLRSVLGSVILTRFFLSLLVIGILNLVIIVLPGGYSPAVKSIFWLASLAIIFQGIYTSGNAWFQSNLSYWRPTLSVVVGSLVGTLLTLYFLAHHPTLFNLILANTLGYLAMALCTLFLLCTSGAIAPEKCLQIRSNLGGPRPYDFMTLRLSTIFPLLRRSLILGLILIASVLASKLDTIVLGIFHPSSIVGEYGFAYRIFDVILVLPVFVMNATYPLMLKSKQSFLRPTLSTLAALGIFVAICLWIFAPQINLIKPGLTLATDVLRLLAYSLPLFYVTAPLMWALISQKRDRLVLIIYVLAALLNLCLNLAFIPGYGAHAAAINTGVTELFIFVCLLYFSRKHLRASLFENWRI
ncbi:MAG: polysaccharide biosynthesis C-terminal domain-containing protein [bacterium]